MAVTNADFRRMIAGSRGAVAEALPPLTVPDRLPHRFEPASRLPARAEPRTIEIVWAPAAPAGGRWLGGLATLAKVLAVPVLLAGGLYARPVYECHKQKSHGMLYYGTTVQMCVGERMAEKVESVQAFVNRQMRAL
ncbi:hypothetical protein SQ03_28580 [Methylobacterium platani JCM 14648]|uniref:Uncharacterized protein n=3 Tax=Methylobacterium platani TaxID=427683 RepID=A0A179RZ21_9HYPH|nr:hypothetical protein SQ03_28580 [Methylobacterium platani JCM 14648]OAS16847.1 hypothetical protein A5481_27740 [Methylobacterium platani]